MKLSAGTLIVAALCFGWAGCEKPDPTDPVAAFDASIDGTVALPTIEANAALLTDAPAMPAGSVEPLNVMPTPSADPDSPVGAVGGAGQEEPAQER